MKDTAAIVWLDHGRGLNHTGLVASKDSRPWDTYLYPTIQYSPRMALLDPSEATVIQLDPMNLHNAGIPAHSAYQLPFFYGQSQPLLTKHSDPFIALHGVFRFAASSAVQFLNLMEATIEHETEVAGVDNACSLTNLRYFNHLLDDHHQKLKENVSTLGEVVSSRSRFGTSPTHQTELQNIERLARDFEYLSERAGTLSESCRAGMMTITIKSIIMKNEKSGMETEDIRRLTWLATVFLPPTLTCLFFGMNFHEFGHGDLSLWIWLVASIPAVAILVGLLYYPIPYYARLISSYLW